MAGDAAKSSSPMAGYGTNFCVLTLKRVRPVKPQRETVAALQWSIQPLKTLRKSAVVVFNTTRLAKDDQSTNRTPTKK